MADRLPPLLGPGLKVVFVGTSPGTESLHTGNYYSDPTNAFYSTLHQSGFTSRQLTPEEHHDLLGIGIGLDDVYDNPKALRQRLEDAAPIAVCFNSKEALKAFAGEVPDAWRGPSASRLVRLAGVHLVWAVPDSSGTASRYRSDRVQLLRQLRDRFGWKPRP